MKTIFRQLVCLILLPLIPLCAACNGGGAGSSEATGSDNTTASSSVEEASSAEAVPTFQQAVTIDETTVRFLGRTLDLNDRKYYNWTCSGFEFTFTGTKVEATLETPVVYANKENERPHIAVYVDDDTLPRTSIVLDKKSGVYTLAENLPQGEHTVRVMKVSALKYSGPFYTSTMTIYGDEAPTMEEPPAAPEKQIEFVGDSITNGFGAIASAASNPYISAEEDGSRSYAYLTARAFGADASFVSISGFGVYADLAGAKNGALPLYYPYDDLSLLPTYQTEGHEWDFEAHPSDAVVIHLGTNDAGPVFNTNILIDGKQMDLATRMAEYKAAYLDFLKMVREKNPDAYIFCIIGGMGCGLDTTIEGLVDQYQQDTGDEKISYYKFRVDLGQVPGGILAGHPSAKVQSMMADELVAHIRSVTGW